MALTPHNPLLKVNLEAWKNLPAQTVDFTVCRSSSEGFQLMDPIKVEMSYSSHDAGVPIEPTFRLPYDVAQLILDELWNSGFRPSWPNQGPGELVAVRAHLADMRSLVESALGVQLPAGKK